MGRTHQSTLLLVLLFAGTALSAARRPQPRYRPQQPAPPAAPAPVSGGHPRLQCQVKEWSSDTELCQPQMEPACEDVTFQTKKITWPGYGKPSDDCKPSTLPKCVTSDEAMVLDLCTVSVKEAPSNLMASLFEQVLVKRCVTHYVTECRPSYGYEAKEKCEEVPVQICYDAPDLKPVEVPIEVKMTTVEENCGERPVPTPKTTCEDEEVNLCPNIPELEDLEVTLPKCVPSVGEEKCQRVRLTIPREVCRPAPPLPAYQPHPAKQRYYF